MYVELTDQGFGTETVCFSAVDNPQEPLILKVKEKDDIIGQVVVPLAELPTKRSDRQR